MANNGNNDKSLESWIWDAACSIRGAKDAPKYKEFILPLIFAKRLCDVFDDELNRIAMEVGSRAKAFKLVKHDKKLVRFFLPLEPKNPDDLVWSIIRKLADKIGEQLTTSLRDIADENSLLKGIIDRVDFNATTHGVRDLDDDRLSNLIERISEKRLGLNDVEGDIIGRSYEYLIRKFAEGSVSSAGEFYTPKEVGMVMARILDPEPGMTVYDPCCGSAGLLIKCQLALEEKMNLRSRKTYAPLQLYGQEYTPETWAAPGIILFLNKAKPKERKDRIFLLNASREFAKGDPKNYLTDDGIVRIAEAFTSWREEEKFSRIVACEEIAKNDFNISPSRYIHTGEADEYRPISEIVEELNALEDEASEVSRTLQKILRTFTVA